MDFIRLTLLLLYLGTTQSSVYTNIKDTVQSFLHRTGKEANRIHYSKPLVKSNALRYLHRNQNDAADAQRARRKARILKKARNKEERLNHGRDIPRSKLAGDPHIGKEYYHMDAVLNQLRRRAKDARRRASSDSEKSQSSSLELRDWKDEFNDYWMQKKFEAVNGSVSRADAINMVAARPWGVPCGDPNQHDMPWGTCMMATQCDGEYRIYRGDYFCGRSQYVCCALLLSNYDLYQGFDVSFADTSFETDSEQKKARERGSKENKKRKKERARRKRKKERRRRKRKIKRNIRKIVHEIRKILNRSFRNASHHRKKRTLILKKYIKQLKKQYRKDRKSVRDIHTFDMERVDEALQNRLDQIKKMNKDFISNSTFRDIIVNGTIDKKGARMLAQAYPELKQYLAGKLRRDGGGEANRHERNYLDYDVEYGALYY